MAVMNTLYYGDNLDIPRRACISGYDPPGSLLRSVVTGWGVGPWATELRRCGRDKKLQPGRSETGKLSVEE
jgi:hypothetical protein